MGDFGVWGICARNNESAGRDAPGAGMHILAVCGVQPVATPDQRPAAVIRR
jgi:hypothetical protein